MTLKVIAELMNEEASEQLKAAISRMTGIDLTVHLPRVESNLMNVVTDQAPDALILEISEESTDDIDNIATIISANRENMVVYIVYDTCSSETMRRLVKAGAKEFLPFPLQAQELAISLLELLSNKQTKTHATQVNGGVSAFINVKGGAGSTLLATNTALMLATEYKKPTVLIDFDVQFGLAAMNLDLHPHSNIMDALIEVERIDPVFVQALMTKHKSGLDVLASPSDIEPINGLITVEGVNKLLDVVTDLYEFVILDIPRLFTPWTIAALKHANPIMLVTHHDLANIRDAKVIMDAFPKMEIPASRIEVINNRAMSKHEETTIDNLKETLHIQKVHRVRNDYKTAIRAEESGVPVAEISAHSDLTKDIKGLARYLAERHLGKIEDEGFFSSLFGKHNKSE